MTELSIPHLSMIDTGSKPREYPANRECASCRSILSRWNPDTVCRLCEVREQRARMLMLGMAGGS